MRKLNRMLTFIMIATIAVGWGIVVALVLMGLSANPTVHFVYLNILSGGYAVVSLLIVFAVRDWMDWIGKAMVFGNCVLSLGQLYFLENRLYHRLLLVLFACSILYLIVGLVAFYLRRRKERWYSKKHLTGYIMVPCFIGFTFLLKTLWLQKLVETDLGDFADPFGFAGLGCGIVGLILALIFIKERGNKTEYFGKVAASFFVPLLLVFGLPLLLTEHTNYAFDTSDGVKTEFVVMEKEIRHTASSKSGPRYYLIVTAEGRTLEFDTNEVIYEQYAEGDSIELYAHTGALGFDYYEYQFDDIYHYNQE